MSKKLYVGNLPFNTTQESLQELFSQYGQVESATIVNDRETQRSRGFGFVEMQNDADAEKAIEALHGSDMGGRTLVVNEARPMKPRGQGFNRR